MAIGADFSVRVFERTLYQPYNLHVSRNSSEILTGMRNAENLVYFIIQPVLTVISAVVILVMVITTLVAVQPLIAITAFLGFGLIYFVIVFTTNRRIALNSQSITRHHVRVTKAIQEGLGGIRDVIIDGNQSVYSESYKNAFMSMQRALTSNQVVSASPRIGVEVLGSRWMALIDETFLRMVEDLMPLSMVCIRKSETVLGSAGRAHLAALSQ